MSSRKTVLSIIGTLVWAPDWTFMITGEEKKIRKWGSLPRLEADS
jgi:hypothetical protein